MDRIWGIWGSYSDIGQIHPLRGTIWGILGALHSNQKQIKGPYVRQVLGPLLGAHGVDLRSMRRIGATWGEQQIPASVDSSQRSTSSSDSNPIPLTYHVEPPKP